MSGESKHTADKRPDSIKVRCIGCKQTKVLSPIPRGDSPPMCNDCYLPMVAVEARGQ